jgi:hypothetical protein
MVPRLGDACLLAVKRLHARGRKRLTRACAQHKVTAPDPPLPHASPFGEQFFPPTVGPNPARHLVPTDHGGGKRRVSSIPLFGPQPRKKSSHSVPSAIFWEGRAL